MNEMRRIEKNVVEVKYVGAGKRLRVHGVGKS
jgi:hypothetical protein